VSPSLRLTLEEDLYWDSDRADSRIKALRSSIIKELSGSINGPLYNKISIGEDSAQLTFKPFADALIKSGLLPTARGNNFIPELCAASLYNYS
jgi:DNA sulfur modification protein DndB